MTRWSALVIALVLVDPGWLVADTVHLRDGTQVEGNIQRVPGGWRVTQRDGTVSEVASGDVVSLVVTGSDPPTTQAADERLFSLRKSVENVDDPRTAVERYRRFIDQHANTPIAADAQADLKVWEDRAERGHVHFGRRWVAPEEAAALREQAFLVVSDARRLLKDRRFKDAKALLSQTLQLEPDNVSASYLTGILAIENEQLPTARRSFEKVFAIIPSHAPTLNNLAVILWRQNQHVAALNRYDQAMQVAPVDGDILDNVAEALNAAPAGARKNTAYERVSKRFAEQDARLQERLLPQGLYRLGSAWVTKDERDAFIAAEKKVQDQLDELAKVYDAGRKTIAAIEQAMEENDRAIEQLKQQQREVLAQGFDSTVDYYGPRFAELRETQARLAYDHEKEVANLDALRNVARDVQKQMPAKPFTGRQRLIGVEGTPLVPPDRSPQDITPPATKP